MPSHLQFRVLENFAFVVSDDDLLVVMMRMYPGLIGTLPPAPWRIDDELRHSVTGRMAAKTFNDLNPFCHGGPKVSRPVNQVALVDVIRSDAAHDKLVDQSPHHGQIIVYPFQENTLVSERYSVVHEALDAVFTSGVNSRG